MLLPFTCCDFPPRVAGAVGVISTAETNRCALRNYIAPSDAQVSEERVPSADVGDAGRVDGDETKAGRRRRLRHRIAPRVPGDRPAVVGDVAAAPDPVHGDDVRLVLDRAGTGQGVPVETAGGGPVCDEDEGVDVAGDGAEELRKAEVVADEGGDANALDRDDHRRVARRVVLVLTGEREQLLLAVGGDDRSRRIDDERRVDSAGPLLPLVASA